VTDSRGLLCLGVGGEPVRFEAESVQFARRAAEHLRLPQSLASLRGRLEGDAGQAIDLAIIEALVGALTKAGVLVADAPALVRAPPSLAGVKIVLGVTGAIASTDAPRIVLALQAQGASVRVALTNTARRFVSKSALEALTHAPVPFRMSSRDPARPVPHIELAQWADVVMIAPASATTLGRVANGDCSDLLSALIIATRAPVLFAPSMNAEMWRAPSTRRNIETLVRDGHAILDPHYGVEVADRPGHRQPHFGGSLPPDRLVRALDVWLRQRAPDVYRGPIDWDMLYREPAALPWLSQGLDEVVGAILRDHAPPPACLLDLGCGTGAQAHAAAQLGYSVVGVDGSEKALAIANVGARGDVIFIKDDLLDLGLRNRFDVLLDRGTLHTLPPSEIARYGDTLARLSHERTILVVVHDGPLAAASAGTSRLSSAELAQLLPAFQLSHTSATTLRKGENGAALCSLFRARALVSRGLEAEASEPDKEK